MFRGVRVKTYIGFSLVNKVIKLIAKIPITSHNEPK